MFHDLKLVLRQWMNRPAFAVVAVMTLALGIGANTAIFSVVDHLLMRPLPVPSPERLAVLAQHGSNGRLDPDFNFPLYQDYARGNTVFQQLSATADLAVGLGVDGVTQRRRALLVSGNYFRMLGVEMALGRGFSVGEGEAVEDAPLAVVSHGLWLRQFGAEPGVIGRSVTLNGYPYTVIGVAPPEFTGTQRGYAPELYVPITEYGRLMADRPGGFHPLETRYFTWHSVMGRLRDGVTLAQARASMRVLSQQVAAVSPANTSTNPVVLPGAQGVNGHLLEVRLPMQLLLGTAALVLLIACANLANLQLARASTRLREFAIRLSLGARRGRLMRQLLTESLLVSLTGGALGLGVAAGLVRWLDAFRPPSMDGVALTSLDLRVLLFTLVASVGTGVVFGLAPAWRASRPDLVPDLKGGPPGLMRGASPRRWTLRGLLVVVQVGLSLVVLMSAGLCLRSLNKLERLDPGFEPSKVVAMSVDLGLNRYPPARAAGFYEELLARVRALPGVESAALAANTPLSGRSWGMSLERVEGYQPTGRERPIGELNHISAGYFRTLGMGLKLGRDFEESDRAGGRPVVIVNEAFVQRYFAGQNPVGKLIYRHGPGDGIATEVIGVAAATRSNRLRAEPAPVMYFPVTQAEELALTLCVRTALDPATTLRRAREMVRAIDAQVPVFGERTLEQQRAGSLSMQRMVASLLAGFGVLALLLASLGVHAMLAFSVARRRREIGVRMAVGATSRDVITLVLRQGLGLAGVGALVGVLGALATGRALRGFLFEVEPMDPVTFTGVLLVLGAVVVLACWQPARRATRVDPVEVLRSEG